MKKLIGAFLTFACLTVVLPVKKAEAGFMITAATQEFVWKHKYETLDTVLVIALPVTMITTGIFAVGIAGNPFNGATIVAGMICLDKKVEGKRNEIAASLQNRYDYIDNAEVLNQLADKVIARYDSTKDEAGNAMIPFSQAEINNVVEQLDLSAEQIADLQTLN